MMDFACARVSKDAAARDEAATINTLSLTSRWHLKKTHFFSV